MALLWVKPSLLKHIFDESKLSINYKVYAFRHKNFMWKLPFNVWIGHFNDVAKQQGIKQKLLYVNLWHDYKIPNEFPMTTKLILLKHAKTNYVVLWLCVCENMKRYIETGGWYNLSYASISLCISLYGKTLAHWHDYSRRTVGRPSNVGTTVLTVKGTKCIYVCFNWPISEAGARFQDRCSYLGQIKQWGK